MTHTRTYRPDAFDMPDGIIYLDGNSLGPLPRVVAPRVAAAVAAQWGGKIVRGWNDCGWFDLAGRIAGRIAPLVGTKADSIAVGDSTSVNLFKVLNAALDLVPGRHVILSETGNFPTDLYIADGLGRLRQNGTRLHCVDAEQIESALESEDVAVLMLTQVNYRTGKRHDMARLTRLAHKAGAVVIWDLAHSAGAFAVELDAAEADFAVGCGYKFLNGGPGAPAFCYVAARHQAALRPALSGWIGHAAPFDFSPDYQPAPGIARMQVGTPPILSMIALDAALEVFDGVDMAELRNQSERLSAHMIQEVTTRCPGLELASPLDASERGSQVSFRHPQGYAIIQALIAEGVIGDFRAPDILRFGITPLYQSADDIRRAAKILGRILETGSWDRPEFHARARVT